MENRLVEALSHPEGHERRDGSPESEQDLGACPVAKRKVSGWLKVGIHQSVQGRLVD